MEIIYDILIKSIFASIASTGFAMLFNVPRHTLVFCAIGGGITYIIRNVSMELGLSIELSTFIASSCIEFISQFIFIIQIFHEKKNMISVPKN